MREMQGLRNVKCFQDGAGQRRIVPATIQLCDPNFLLTDMMRAARDVPLGFRQMSKLH